MDIDIEGMAVESSDVGSNEDCRHFYHGRRRINLDKVFMPLYMPKLCTHQPRTLDEKKQKLQQIKDNKYKVMKISREKQETVIRENIAALSHACNCLIDNCGVAMCITVKRLLRHVKNCKHDKRCCCPTCNLMIAISIGHAKECQETDCTVVFCSVIKKKIKQRQEKHRQMQQQSR